VVAALTAACVDVDRRRVDRLSIDGEGADRPTPAAATLGPIAWRVGDASAARTTAAAPQDPARQESAEERDARLRLQFGSNVLIGADGLVTKQYFLAGELAQTFLKLIADITPEKSLGGVLAAPPAGARVGGPNQRSILGRMLRQHEVEVSYVPDFEILSGARLAEFSGGNVPPAVTGEPPDLTKKAPSVGLALITAKPGALAAFEAALNLFYGSIPQVEITVRVIEYQTADALAFGVNSVDSNTPILGNLSSSQLVRAYTSRFPLRQPTLGTSPVTDIGSFVLGGIHDSWELNMVLESLQANSLADVTSAPKLVVRNGGVAAISTLTQVPFPKARINQIGLPPAVDIEFKPVGVRMNIIPVIAGTDSVILQVYADVSAITGFANTDPQTPITSTRTALTTVYLKNENTLVIGGLRSKAMFETESKVPLLGDIPLLGFLFRSTSQTRNDTTVEFHITPRIVEDRGDPPQPEQPAF
jgi:hypothetical protein